MQVCLTMKIETASMLSYNNRNCKYYFNAKVETASMLHYEIETASMLNYGSRKYKYA